MSIRIVQLLGSSILVTGYVVERVQQILENLKALGRARLLALGGVGAMLVAAVLVGLNIALAPTFTPLYSELSASSANRIVTSLEQGGFRVSLSRDGSVVSVPQEDIARARMMLADAGLPTEGSPGWELFDAGSGLGMNTFLQQVNRLRALEGELARSIQTIDGVEAARVHLVLPEREAFSRSRPEPSASVIIRSRRGDSVTLRQAVAIRALVASAVPDLAPGRITVLSASGETILAEDGQETPGSMLQSRKTELEERMAGSIMSILNARVGSGNARVQVNVDLSTVRQVTLAQSFDPEGQVVRSTEIREESARDQQPGEQEVGVAGNLPGDFGEPVPAGALNETERTDEIVNYEIGSTRTETVSEPGALERISVAVLVDGVYSETETGEVVFTPRDQAELDRLSELVKAAVGFNAARGDTVSVDSLQFVEVAADIGAPAGSTLTEMLTANLTTILRGVFALALVAAVLALGLRPAMKMLLAQPAPALAGPDGQPLAVAGQDTDRRQITGPDTMDGATGILLSHDEEGGEMLRVASVVGGVSRRRIDRAGALAAQRPEETLRTVKGWLAAKA
jgi:flagellar M-ring protein FliF